MKGKQSMQLMLLVNEKKWEGNHERPTCKLSYLMNANSKLGALYLRNYLYESCARNSVADIAVCELNVCPLTPAERYYSYKNVLTIENLSMKNEQKIQNQWLFQWTERNQRVCKMISVVAHTFTNTFSTIWHYFDN